jgi:hypothetical protein
MSMTAAHLQRSNLPPAGRHQGLRRPESPGPVTFLSVAVKIQPLRLPQQVGLSRNVSAHGHADAPNLCCGDPLDEICWRRAEPLIMAGLGAHPDRGGEPRPRALCEKLPTSASPLLLNQ